MALDWTPPILVKDQDSDGVEDANDLCPDEPGPVETNGCPDIDGDGIVDSKDDCPKIAGIPDNNGCPEIAEEVKEVLKEALEGIEFESGRDIIRPLLYVILDKVVDVMKNNPEFKLNIAGHTDSMGK